MLPHRVTIVAPVIALLTSFFLASCGSSSSPSSALTNGCTGKALTGKTTLTAWYHTGQPSETSTTQAQVAAFNASQNQVHVNLVDLPEGNYDDQVKAAAAANQLPDVLDFDGPLLYNYAWNKQLRPLDNCISSSLKSDLLPDILKQGTYANHLYGIGAIDSGLGLYVRTSILQKYNIRIPTSPSDAWTADEFTQALKTLQAAGYQHPLDLKMDYGKGEFFTYAFSPIIESAGGDLINRSTYQTASNVLNSDASVQALTTFQSWFKDNLVDPDTDGNAFILGRTPISWVGHWVYNDYTKAWGSDVTLVPLPNFGKGSVTGTGSWQWGITTNAKNADAAWAFINYLMQPAQLVQLTTADGAIPTTNAALAQEPQFSPGGAEYLYAEQLKTIGVPRPQTPAYPAITSAFAQAIQDISTGEDVKTALDTAVQTINQDIQDNDGYPVTP